MNGRLLPFGWWHFLRRRKIIDRCRVGFLGVKPEYQHTGVAAALYVEHFDLAARGPGQVGRDGLDPRDQPRHEPRDGGHERPQGQDLPRLPAHTGLGPGLSRRRAPRLSSPRMEAENEPDGIEEVDAVPVLADEARALQRADAAAGVGRGQAGRGGRRDVLRRRRGHRRRRPRSAGRPRPAPLAPQGQPAGAGARDALVPDRRAPARLAGLGPAARAAALRCCAASSACAVGLRGRRPGLPRQPTSQDVARAERPLTAPSVMLFRAAARATTHREAPVAPQAARVREPSVAQPRELSSTVAQRSWPCASAAAAHRGLGRPGRGGARGARRRRRRATRSRRRPARR